MNKPMNQEKIKQMIIQWEQKFPVNEWRIEGVDLWPYIRIKLYLFLLNYGQQEKPSVRKTNKSIHRYTSGQRYFKSLISIPRSLISLYFFFKKLRPKSIIFFGAHFHRTLQDGLYFNRFFDPMIARHNLNTKVYLFEYEKVFENSFNHEGIIDLHKNLDKYKLLSKLKAKFKFRPKRKQSGLKRYDIFYNDLTNEIPEAVSLKITEPELDKWAIKISNTKNFFLKVYQKVKPEKLLFLSYYGYDDLAAAILAGHELKIKSIDFQHGPQTNVHMAYSNWTKHPENPYNTMPLEYWNWDLESKINIEEWALNTKNIKSKMVGHPYLAYCLGEENNVKSRDFIFFSLQTLTLEEMLPEKLLSVIEPSNCIWIFRMHPRSNFNSNDLKNYLYKQGVSQESYFIQDALKVPLPSVLARARLHLTNFSGCVLEALMLGIPSILIHEAGREIFQNYIDQKKVFYIDVRNYDFQDKLEYLLEAGTSKIINSQKKIVNPLLEE